MKINLINNLIKMKNIRLKIGVGVLIALIITAGLIAYFVFKTPTITKPKCGDGVCGNLENWKSCQLDCDKPLKAFCGDKVCGSKEVGVCAQDCPKKPVCGDGICSLNENCDKDCEITPPPSPLCGDNICSTGETCSSCSADCGSCSSQQSNNYEIALSNMGGWSPDQIYFDFLDGLQLDWSRANFLDATSRKVKDVTEAKTFCERYCNEPLNTGINCENLQAGQSFICNLKVPRSEIFDDEGDNNIRLTLQEGFNLVGTLDIAAYRNEESFRAFVHDTVEYFGDDIKYWEIGNEVDQAVFWGGTPEEYGELVKTASKEIKDTCADCKVGISFVSPMIGAKDPRIRENWFNVVRNICDEFDFIDAHLLLIPSEDQLRGIKRMVADWDNLCSGKEFISTETSVTLPKQDGLANQARLIIKLYAVIFDAGYKKIFYRTLFDTPDYEGPDAGWAHDGLITAPQGSNTPVNQRENKPAFYSFKTLTEKIGGFSSVTKITDTQYKFIVNGRNVYVLWGSGNVPSEISGSVKVTDYLGNEETKNASQIVLTNGPIFVE